MRAVSYEDVRTVAVRDVPDPSIEAHSDAVVRVAPSAICGTDLHMYDGRTGAEQGLVLGHEAVGVVQQVGAAVDTITPGMRVVIPTHLYCGTCHMCARGLSAACLRARRDGVGTAYGYAGIGPLPGISGRTAAGAVGGRQLPPGARRTRRRRRRLRAAPLRSDTSIF